jgi:hypothetical protein
MRKTARPVVWEEQGRNPLPRPDQGLSDLPKRLCLYLAPSPDAYT